MGQSAGIRVKEPFTAFGHSYGLGELVPEAHHGAWPDGVLERRLRNGFVEHSSEPARPEDKLSPEEQVAMALEGDNSEGDKELGLGAGIEPQHMLASQYDGVVRMSKPTSDGSDLIGDNSEGDKELGYTGGVEAKSIPAAIKTAEQEEEARQELLDKNADEDLEHMSKAELADLAQRKYGLKLSVATKNRDEMIEAIRKQRAPAEE